MIKTSRLRLLGLFLGAFLAVAPVLTYAIGLGKIKVHSALDEPLNAEIPFTSLSQKELKRLKAELAGRDEFVGAGIDRSLALTDIKFTVAKRVDGSYFLQLRTDKPFREPFLHFLVYIEWAGGRLIREYSALIDPPYLLAVKPAKIEAPVTAAVPEPMPQQVEELPELAPAVSTTVPEVLPDAEKKSEAPAEIAVEEIKEEPKAETDKAETDKAEAEKAVEPEPAAKEPELVALVDDVVEEDPFGNEIFGPTGIGARVKMDRRTGWPVDPVDPDALSVEPLEPVAAKEQLIIEPEKSVEETPALTTTQYDASMLGDEYHVKRGDTLWEIAEEVRPRSDLSVQQVVMAIYRSNRHAFFEDNVNNLKAGKILKIPDSEELLRQSHKDVRAQFQTHYDVWQEYKLKRAAARQAIPAPDTQDADMAPVVAAPKEKPKPAVKPKAEPKAVTKKKPLEKQVAKKPEAQPAPKKQEAKSEPEKGTAAEDLLKIVRATLEKKKDVTKPAGDTEAKSRAVQEKSELADRVASTEESLHSKEMETKEMGERVGQVKEQLEKQKRLMELENAKLAQNQPQKPGAAPAAKPAAPAAKPAAKAGPQKPVERAQPAVPPPPPPAEKGFVEDLMEQVTGGSFILPIVGGVVLVLGILGAMYMRRRKQATLEFEESILNSTMDSETTGDTEGDAGDTSFLSDFSQGGMGNISTDEVDPVAEAEVYMAYGRDEQAEEILREAIMKDPSRHEVRHKLLEIYHSRGDVGAFETLAEELYAALGGQGGEMWAQVAELGRSLNPDNPMFAPGAGGAGGIADVDSTAEMEDSTNMLDDMLAMEQTSSQKTMIVPSEAEEDGGLDFESPAKADDAGIDMDMGGLDIGGDEASAGGDGIDFSMDFESGAGAAEEKAASTDDDGGLAFDMGDDGGLDFAMEETPAEEEGGLSLETAGDEGGGIDFGLEEEAAV
ncbi:MAG: LysM peptidoglycan-binding domain-containing protein, partial [Gammaproteobacteria bacterium]|nr:LysM peptidoglycan-binding domain-containing protein [Gammaproteobacteria bacterium]